MLGETVTEAITAIDPFGYRERIPQIRVHVSSKIGRASFDAKLDRDGTRVVLKPQADWADLRVAYWLHHIRLGGVPYLWGQTDYRGNPYWVMEWIRGDVFPETLVPAGEARRRIASILAIFQRLHRLSGLYWFHLDLKPSHLIRCPQGNPAVIDFESCRLGRIADDPADPGEHGCATLLVTPSLADGKLIRGNISFRNDHYALAKIWLSWLSAKRIENLDRRTIKRTLAMCSSADRDRIRRALAGKGLTVIDLHAAVEEQGNQVDRPEQILRQSEPEVSESKTVPEHRQKPDCRSASEAVMLQSRDTVASALNHPHGSCMMTNKITSQKGLIKAMDMDRIERAVREILIAVGEDPDRPGLVETPARVARMYREVFSGLADDPREFIKIFHEPGNDEMILVGDIPFYSMCEHHLLPFIGKAHVVYIPRDGRIFGLSKVARIVDNLARKPQLQERLTSQIADLIAETINPYGVCVVLEAEHLCMTMRGIQKPGSKTVTSALRGVCKTDLRSRAEAMSLIGKLNG